MISRITNQTLMRTAQLSLHANMTRMSKLQDQATNQKAITRPSDDPTATVQSLQVRAEQRATDQYSRNADNGNGWLTTVDSALGATTDILRRVRDLTVQGANDGSMSVAAKEAIAIEIEGLRDDLLRQANTAYLGRNVFAGNSDAGAAFTRTAGAARPTHLQLQRATGQHRRAPHRRRHHRACRRRWRGDLRDGGNVSLRPCWTTSCPTSAAA